jgi:hypothetical protein
MPLRWVPWGTLIVLAVWAVPAPAQAPSTPEAAPSWAVPPAVLGGDPGRPWHGPEGERIPPAAYVDDDRYWPGGPPLGWFLALEGTLTTPRQTVATDYFAPGPGAPDTDFGLTVAPRVALGRRFEPGNAVVASYRFLTGDGSATSEPHVFFARQQVHRELTAHWLDLTYVTTPRGPWCNFRYQWELGARVAYLASEEQTRLDHGGGWQPWVNTRDSIWAVGPHLGFDLAWSVGQSGWAIYSRVDLALLFGSTREETAFGELPRDGVIYVPMPPASTATNTASAVGDAQWELGLRWAPPERPWMRVTGGARSEAFSWQSRRFQESGLFLRYELGF